MKNIEIDYTTGDLNLLESYCFSTPELPVDPSDLMDTPSLFSSIMEKADLSVLGGQDNEAAAFDGEWLERIENSNSGILSVIYFRNGKLNEREKSIIRRLVNDCKIRVRQVTFSVRSVVTDAHFTWQSDAFGSENHHHFMLAADNHDLYSENLLESTRRPFSHLITQRDDSRLSRVITSDVRWQMTEDRLRFRHAVKALRRRGVATNYPEVV